MTALLRLRRLRAAGGAIRITAFGSSTTEGTGASDPRRTAYPARMEAALRPHLPPGLHVVNAGVAGETVEGMRVRFEAVLATAPDLVVWQAGSNDGPRCVALARFEAGLRLGIERFGAAGADIMLLEPQWSRALEGSARFPPFLRAVRTIGATTGIPVFPRHTLMQLWAAETGLGIDGLSPDGLHMADAGYALLGAALADAILSLSAPMIPPAEAPVPASTPASSAPATSAPATSGPATSGPATSAPAAAALAGLRAID